MDLRLWTTPEEVRALLGLQPADIDNATLLLPVYGVGLEADLRDISPRLISEFKRVASLPSPTEDEGWFLRVTRAFAAHAVAKQALTALPLAAVRDASDGKSSEARFNGSPYADTMQRLESAYATAKARVAPALSSLTTTTTSSSSEMIVPTFMAVSSPSYNPITG